MYNREWTKEEDKIIEEYAGRVRISELTGMINRTTDAIKHRAVQKGLLLRHVYNIVGIIFDRDTDYQVGLRLMDSITNELKDIDMETYYSIGRMCSEEYLDYIKINSYAIITEEKANKLKKVSKLALKRYEVHGDIYSDKFKVSVECVHPIEAEIMFPNTNLYGDYTGIISNINLRKDVEIRMGRVECIETIDLIGSSDDGQDKFLFMLNECEIVYTRARNARRIIKYCGKKYSTSIDKTNMNRTVYTGSLKLRRITEVADDGTIKIK